MWPFLFNHQRFSSHRSVLESFKMSHIAFTQLQLNAYCWNQESYEVLIPFLVRFVDGKVPVIDDSVNAKPFRFDPVSVETNFQIVWIFDHFRVVFTI